MAEDRQPASEPSADELVQRISNAARIELAAEMRRGMHLLVGRNPSADEMTALTTALRTGFDALDQAPERSHSNVSWQGPSQLDVPEDGQAFPDSLNRPVSGSGNAFSVPMVMYRDGDMVTSTVLLEDAFEGAPGRSHGGLVSAIFDDLFGSVPMLQRKIAFTASLTVNYVAPSPVREPVTFRAWVDHVEGKKMYLSGEALHGDTLVTTASALFIDASEYIERLYGPPE